LFTNRPWSGFYRTALSAVLIWLSVANLALGQSLSVGMNYPQFRASFITGSAVEIRATATAPPGETIAKVEFFLATFATGPKTTTKLGEDLTAPYSYTWTIPEGQISYNELSVKVTSATGATAVQGGVGYIRVDVYPPTTNSNKKYYVKEGATAGNNGLSVDKPFATIQNAADVVQPGDSVFVMEGTYRNTGTGDAVVLRRTGTPEHWIVFTNYQNDKPKLSFNGYQGFQLNPGSAYIRIQGFDIEGNNANITLAEATNQPGSCDNPGLTPLPKYNGNGISLSGRNGGNFRPHHIVIANNVVHDCAGAGISAIESDYVTIENNIVYNNAWYTIFGASGISVLNAWNYDNNTDTPRTIIRNNRCYGNRLFVKWNNAGVCQGITDGNGIILDNNNDKFSANPLGAYTGQFLVENNLAYENGGRGINLNYTDNVTLRNNTCYKNAVSPEIKSELVINSLRNGRIYNNVFYARPEKQASIVNTPVNVIFNNNLTFGGTGTPYLIGNQNITGLDPQFADVANNDFQLTAASPALNAGSTQPGQYAPKDILGVNRPQGAGVDIGAYELQGIPVSMAQQPASSSAVCAGTNVTTSVRVDGPVQSYQWYKDGSALTGVTSATLALTGVTTDQQGSYVVVVTGFNSLTSNAFSLTVNSPSVAPDASSLTTIQGTPNVTLSVSNCPGIVNWNGSDGEASLPVLTAAVGEFVYSVTCKTGACISPVTSVTVSVKAPPATLSVYHRDADNNQWTNNTIRPYLKLYNEGTAAVPYSEITLRYWLTVEDFAPLTNLSVYWAELGTSKVKLKYVALPQPRQGAYGYVEYSFDASAGNLASGSNSGEIQTGLGKQNWTAFNEADDYSFAPNATYTKNDRITVYRNGSLVGGIEPAAIVPVTALKIYSENKNSNPATNQISTHLKLTNEGNLPVDYSQLTIRYWFSSEGDKPLVYTVDYADLGRSNIRSTFVKDNRAGTDTYLELSFAPTLGSLNSLSSTGIIQQRINKNDWSTFNEANDYSYRPAGALAENAKITAYLNGALVYGQEPAPSGARLLAEEPSSALRVVVLGNPVQGDAVSVVVSGAEGQPLQLLLTNMQGQPVSWRSIEKASSVERHDLPVGRQPAGMLLLQVRTLNDNLTVKLLKQ